MILLVSSLVLTENSPWPNVCMKLWRSFMLLLVCSQSLEEVEGDEAARGTKEKARTAPTWWQLPQHRGQEAAELNLLSFAHLPLCYHSTKCLHSTNHKGYQCFKTRHSPQSYYSLPFLFFLYPAYFKGNMEVLVQSLYLTFSFQLPSLLWLAQLI